MNNRRRVAGCGKGDSVRMGLVGVTLAADGVRSRTLSFLWLWQVFR